MALFLFFVSLGLFLIIRIPLAFAMGLSSLIFLLCKGNIPLMIIVQKTFAGTDSFPMLALPLFIYAGAIMNVGGIAKRLIDCASALVGHIRGGLAMVNIVASMFFGGISGSAVADTSALGSVLIPGMVKKGYKPDFSAAVTAASATIGIIIPPSIAMILYAVVSEVSVGELFIAGMVPGILVGLSQMVIAYIISVRKGYPVEGQFNVRQALKAIKNGFWALIMPVIILGSIIGGVCTPTESAGIAVIYGMIVSVFIYRSMSWKRLWEATYQTVVTTATIMIIIGFGALVGWILSYSRVPVQLAEFILSISTTRWVILLMIDAFLILLGTFMHGTPIILVVIPILLPLVQRLDVSLVHFGMIVIFNIGIGQQTPPLGTCLFVTSALANLDILEVARADIPFIMLMIGLLLLITYVPVVSLFFPSLLM
jgi:tripartite ATP-independent transporter DctM subunit